MVWVFIDKKPYPVGTDPLSRNIQKLVFLADFWAPVVGWTNVSNLTSVVPYCGSTYAISVCFKTHAPYWRVVDVWLSPS